MTKKNMEMEMFEEEYDNAEKCSLSQKSANMPNGEIVSKKNVDGRMKWAKHNIGGGMSVVR